MFSPLRPPVASTEVFFSCRLLRFGPSAIGMVANEAPIQLSQMIQ
ncbi:hypothetical protein C7410_11977 [Paraburkholderia silvatlantica]|uniref:Uncharacterized protein n=1 Tax=Paraburkholderia silvatlantica TaxID=321895 RepID=A0A2V4THA8_9BURK|nr:hypothetical protein C7410_11977 [Paraburkholderia silvatlantica]TDQ89534.1 hypothetical protein C7412_115167 [Paraburkholderia silvatlantica]